MVRNTSPSGEQRTLMTNLFNDKLFPADCFAELYQQHWGIEEAFKRLKHRLSMEHVTGLTQQVVVQDVAAKIVFDNLQALVAITAHADTDLPDSKRIEPAADTDTLYQAASISKGVTGALAQRLAGSTGLQLDDPVDACLRPWTLPPERKAPSFPGYAP
ncbi:MAG: serine hydrolase [Pseudomonadota bacterium]|nr:serine hydrolase [Pseudomonadota bacterium]